MSRTSASTRWWANSSARKGYRRPARAAGFGSSALRFQNKIFAMLVRGAWWSSCEGARRRARGAGDGIRFDREQGHADEGMADPGPGLPIDWSALPWRPWTSSAAADAARRLRSKSSRAGGGPAAVRLQHRVGLSSPPAMNPARRQQRRPAAARVQQREPSHRQTHRPEPPGSRRLIRRTGPAGAGHCSRAHLVVEQQGRRRRRAEAASHGRPPRPRVAIRSIHGGASAPDRPCTARAGGRNPAAGSRSSSVARRWPAGQHAEQCRRRVRR